MRDAVQTSSPAWSSCAAIAYLVAAVFAAAIGLDLVRMPVQVYDSLDELIDAQASPSAVAMFQAALVEDRSHLRAFRHAQTKVLFDVAGGYYRRTFRGFHAALVLSALLLFARSLRVRGAIDVVAAIFALTVLLGLHTFRGGTGGVSCQPLPRGDGVLSPDAEPGAVAGRTLD